MSNKISDDNQPDITNAPAILKHAIPSPKENVVFKSVTGAYKWMMTSVAAISIYNSLKAKKPQFVVKSEDLTWVIGGGIASGLLEGIGAINNNKQFDSFVQKLEQEKLQAQVTRIR